MRRVEGTVAKRFVSCRNEDSILALVTVMKHDSSHRRRPEKVEEAVKTIHTCSSLS